MGLETLIIHGIEELHKKILEIGEKKIFIFFSGSHVDGKSWCPDCVKAEPVVQEVVKSADIQKVDATFITCFVGERDYWKSPTCPFRTVPCFQLKCIPTLLELNKDRRIIDDEVSDKDKVFSFINQ